MNASEVKIRYIALSMIFSGCTSANNHDEISSQERSLSTQTQAASELLDANKLQVLDYSKFGFQNFGIILFLIISTIFVIVIIFTRRKNKKEALSVQDVDSNDIRTLVGLNEAVATLARDLAARERETQKLYDIIIRKEQKRVLSRVCSIYETAEFTRRINAASKINDKEALNQLLMEIESALTDIGLEIFDISPGAIIKNLPAGSFTIISAEIPEVSTNAGRVKEVVSSAIYIKEASGILMFISPAKLKVYKL